MQSAAGSPPVAVGPEMLKMVEKCVQERVRVEVEARLQTVLASMRQDVERLQRQLENMLFIAHAKFDGPPKATSSAKEEPKLWYRNIKYSDSRSLNPSKRLTIFDEPDPNKESAMSLFFGDLLPVKKEQEATGGSLWLQLGAGATAAGVPVEGRWVLAKYLDRSGEEVKQCAKLTGCEKSGKPKPEEYVGQDFGRMFTEGYDGHRDIVLLSASGQAFWQAVNITCLLRNVGTSTVFEQGWADSLDAFDAWVAYYAVNVYRYALASGRKKLCITVKPTANWQRYAVPRGRTATIEAVAGDLGRAQQAECKWLFGMCHKLGFQWSDMRFYTAQSFLREHGNWTVQDCADEALKQLESVERTFGDQPLEAMESDLFAQIFCLEEAFDCADLQELLKIPKTEQLRPSSGSPAAPSAPGRPRLSDDELKPLWAMRTLWGERREQLKRALRSLNLPSFADPELLVSHEALHQAAAFGSSEAVVAVRAVLATLRKSLHGTSCLLQPAKENKSTPLHIAARNGAVEVARLFLDEARAKKQVGAVLLSRDGQGKLPLPLASAEVRPLLVQAAQELVAETQPSLEQLKDFAEMGLTWSKLLEAGAGTSAWQQAFGAGDLRAAGFDAGDLRQAGFDARAMCQAGFNAGALGKAGFEAEVICTAGFGAGALCQAGFDAGALRRAGVGVRALCQAGFNAHSLHNAGIDPRALHEAGVGAASLRQAGFDARALRQAGLSAGALREAGFNAWALQEAGFLAEALHWAGFDREALLQAGYGPSDLDSCGIHH